MEVDWVRALAYLRGDLNDVANDAKLVWKLCDDGANLASYGFVLSSYEGGFLL